MGLVDMSSVSQAGWFALPRPMHWGIHFKLEAIIPMAFLYLVGLVEFVGDTTGVAINAVDRTPTEREFTGGILMTGLAFIPKISQLVVSTPPPVLGGVLISMFSMIVVSGIKVISSQNLTQRNMLVIGVALGVGMGLNGRIEAIAILPDMVQHMLSGIGGTGLVALLLNIVLPRTEEDEVLYAAGQNEAVENEVMENEEIKAIA